MDRIAPETIQLKMPVHAAHCVLLHQDVKPLLSILIMLLVNLKERNGYYIGNTPAIPRLNIPSINSQDAAQGFRTIDPSMYGLVTSWPCSLGAAATWDVQLVEQWGQALGKEFRAKGANMILGPSLNVHRVPLGGRNAEYISGEDAYLGTKMVPAYIKGVQSQKVMANIKHYILNNQETNRGGVSSNVGERAMMELYWPPFAAGALAGAASAMCSYNLVNGTHSCGNNEVLNNLLKGGLNWTGFVTSDWNAIHGDGYQTAGLDMDNPGNDGFFNLEKLQGDPSLDDMATRIIAALIEVDAFDNPVCTGGIDCGHYLYEVNATSAEHAELARSIAAASASLLKNDNRTLPIKEGLNVAVVGDACNAPNDVKTFSAWNAVNPFSTSILSGIRQRAAQSNVKITSDISAADIIITCGATTSTEGNDRSNLLVDQDQEIKNIVDGASKPVVVLLQGPGALVTGSFDEKATSIVFMPLAGQATGLAWADILFGDVNPSGKLPITFPISESDTIQPCQGSTCEYNEGLAVGYRGLEGKAVAFPFGHGADVPQLYILFPEVAKQPSRVLKGFNKTNLLNPGESDDITFELTDFDLSMWSVEFGSFVPVNGLYNVTVGSSSRDSRINISFSI
eukprot:UC4_evm3s125